MLSIRSSLLTEAINGHLQFFSSLYYLCFLESVVVFALIFEFAMHEASFWCWWITAKFTTANCHSFSGANGCFLRKLQQRIRGLACNKWISAMKAGAMYAHFNWNLKALAKFGPWKSKAPPHKQQTRCSAIRRLTFVFASRPPYADKFFARQLICLQLLLIIL